MNLRQRWEIAHQNERHDKRSETLYWFNQYKLLAKDAIDVLVAIANNDDDESDSNTALKLRELALSAVGKKDGPRQWKVTYFYLATGMEGHADMREDPTLRAAKTRQEAIDLSVASGYWGEDSLWLRSCLDAKRVR